jgi:hypothetical protein
MTSGPILNSEEMADRLAIRELVDAYAFCADRRDETGQMALFTSDWDPFSVSCRRLQIRA